jgi:hypothetical protein
MTTVGWGCLDYFLGNMLIRDAEENDPNYNDTTTLQSEVDDIG